jgi:hypothetical protein
MSWALWLLPTLAVPALAALWTWLRARPVRMPSSDEAMRAHHDYLEALVVPARGTHRVERG